MSLERGKIREFARATASTAPEYLDDPAPPVPPTFLRTSTFWEPEGLPAPTSELNLDNSRCLHGEEEFEFFGPPPRAGAELTVVSRLESVTEKQGRRGGTMRVFVSVQDFTDADGRLVARRRTTGIETGKAPE
ncbi:MaoC family dehydratase N-terminal domain-containing protein [Frankia sp. R43]|uniref:FAS1-like dehydratase domain-containing protein n=1 Tax=Frankia sp. R43 TaxID=269536 RepID=UPI0009FA7E1E|nr:MaoC family dehydratase N-terminal domain-containing protein [Frankia sp. R43]